MATTRRRARTDEGQFQGDDPSTPVVNEAWLNAQALSEFIGVSGDEADLTRALELARNAAQRALGRPIPEEMPHALAQAIKLLAARLLLANKLDDEVNPSDIPLVVRYYLRLSGAQG
jgi:hypothetical protein